MVRLKNGAQKKLAEATGFSEAYISQILSGARKVNRIDTSRKLSHAIGRADTFFLTEAPAEIRKAVQEYFSSTNYKGLPKTNEMDSE